MSSIALCAKRSTRSSAGDRAAKAAYLDVGHADGRNCLGPLARAAQLGGHPGCWRLSQHPVGTRRVATKIKIRCGERAPKGGSRSSIERFGCSSMHCRRWAEYRGFLLRASRSLSRTPNRRRANRVSRFDSGNKPERTEGPQQKCGGRANQRCLGMCPPTMTAGTGRVGAPTEVGSTDPVFRTRRGHSGAVRR